MLEILFVLFLWRKLGGYLEDKGYVSTILMKLFLVVSWLVGEILGAVVGVVVAGEDSGVLTYVGALVGAFAGAGVVFLIAKLMPVRTHEVEPLAKDRPSPVQHQMPTPERQQVPHFEPPVPGQPKPTEPTPPEAGASLEFPCPQCQNAIAWIAEYAGQEVSCPHCTEALVVPLQT